MNWCTPGTVLSKAKIIKYGIFKKIANRIETEDGKKVYAKSIYDNPDEYFTSSVMERLEAAAQKEYQYGSYEEMVEEDSEGDAGL